jgi:hypothetical protein
MEEVGIVFDSAAAGEVLALAWPESIGFGLAWSGFGSLKSQARPKHLPLAWLGLALAWVMAFPSSLYLHENKGMEYLDKAL